jgi:hypothetical protein
MKGDRPIPQGSLKKRHLGLVGLITVVLQYGLALRSEQSTTDAIQTIAQSEIAKVEEQIKTQKAELQAAVEKDFVRKHELSELLKRFDRKLERIDEATLSLGRQISEIDGFLKSGQAAGPVQRPREYSRR